MLKLRQPVVIVGLGKTGYACLRFLNDRAIETIVVDSRKHPPLLEQAKENYPTHTVLCGSLDISEITSAGTLIVSPGISIQTESLVVAAKNGAEIIGDIELFSRVIQSPVIAITGSNGKSTVTDLLGKLLSAIDLNIEVGGNIGIPVLELSLDENVDYYILELSSFQLETTQSLAPLVATVLNVSPDHLDRYQGMEEYLKVKLSIFKEKTKAVLPFEQSWNLPKTKELSTFSLDKESTVTLVKIGNEQWLTILGKPWLSTAELQLFGKHNHLNILAALAIIEALGIDLFGIDKKALAYTLKNYKGLPHRCEVIRKQANVLWINDSKATNTASAEAAIESFSEKFSGKIVLIAGGDAKDADLSFLKESISSHVYALITFGKDGNKIAALANPEVILYTVNNISEAVEKADAVAPTNGVVLLSPACASLDMFSSYVERGECFRRAVEELAA